MKPHSTIPKPEQREKMRALRAEGMPLQEIADRFGVSRSRVGKVVGPYTGKALSPTKRLERAQRALELYRCGLTLAEVAERVGMQSTNLCSEMQGLPGYSVRRGRRRIKERDVIVPKWVPEPMRDRYALLTLRHDEHVAAACIRQAKQLGVSL